MHRAAIRLVFLFALLLTAVTVSAQPSATTSVPRVVRLTGVFVPANGMPPAPVETITLAIYGEEAGGAPLWQETQYVTVESAGRYTVLLGATQPDGLPLDIFASGDARWVGRRFERVGEPEQARVSLPSVPYALKAADADTLGGLPPSAYLLADPTGGGGTSVAASSAPAASPASAPQAATSGTAGCIGEFTNTTDLGCSPMVDVGGAIGLGTSTPLDRFHVRFTNTNGAFTGLAVQNLGSTATSYSGMLFYDQNGALGLFQGFNNSTHEYRINNIASSGSINFMLGGASKLQLRSDGNVNLAGYLFMDGTVILNNRGTESVGVGANALATGTGSRNNAVGLNALGRIGAGSLNNAFGSYALQVNTDGDENSGFGDQSLSFNTTGFRNTAIGSLTLAHLSSGSENIALGARAGLSMTTGSNNIAIGNGGVNSESGVIRIGTGGTHSKFFAAGVRGRTTGVADAIPVVIDSNGQLGTVSSSRRFKEDIRDMGDASRALFNLRPVTFRYAKAYNDGAKPIQYGLVAEEVAEVFPDLAVKNAEGGVDTVHYETLSVLLLNELQKQHETVGHLQEQNRALTDRLAAVEALLSRVAAATAATAAPATETR